MIYTGWDPGKTGAMVALTDKGALLEYEPYPIIKAGSKKVLDLVGICQWVSNLGIDYAIRATIEQVSARRGQGATSIFSFGRSLGVIEGVIAASGISKMYATPQAWQKMMLAGKPKGKDSKASAILTCTELWPELAAAFRDMNKEQREGIADAALIAEYGRRQWQ